MGNPSAGVQQAGHVRSRWVRPLAAVKSSFLRYANTRLASGETVPPVDPAAIVAAVHREMAARLIEVGRFVTGCFVRIDLVAPALTYVDCGHPGILVHRARDGQVELLRQDWTGLVNLPLGFHLDTVHRAQSVALVPGDTILLYPDGLTEATGEDITRACPPRCAACWSSFACTGCSRSTRQPTRRWRRSEPAAGG